ncbi:hypothetical protein [Ralstonia sp. 1B3]|uniref:hypothetical protein n=1 Tax=Ralstonia sp. 1B3 TaxID=2997421 RepID=UPI002FCBA997
MQRLRQCHAILANRSQTHRSVAEIAQTYGFSDASNFTRAYRRDGDVAPRDAHAGRRRARRRHAVRAAQGLAHLGHADALMRAAPSSRTWFPSLLPCLRRPELRRADRFARRPNRFAAAAAISVESRLTCVRASGPT